MLEIADVAFKAPHVMSVVVELVQHALMPLQRRGIELARANAKRLLGAFNKVLRGGNNEGQARVSVNRSMFRRPLMEANNAEAALNALEIILGNL